MTETAIRNEIVKYLNSFPTARFMIRRPGSEAGEADIFGSFNGRHCEFECKRPKNPSRTHKKLQDHKRTLWRNARAIVGVVRSVEDVRAVLRNYGESV